MSPVGDLTLSFGGLRVPALVRLISEFYLSVSVAVSGGDSERKKPSSDCADLVGKTLPKPHTKTLLIRSASSLTGSASSLSRSASYLSGSASYLLDLRSLKKGFSPSPNLHQKTAANYH